MRFHRGQLSLSVSALGSGIQAHAGIGVQLFQEVKVLPVFLDEVSYGALVNGCLHIQVPDAGLGEQFSLPFQFQRRQFHKKVVQNHFYGPVLPFWEMGVHFQAYGNLKPSETACPQAGGSIGRCREMPPVVFQSQGL